MNEREKGLGQFVVARGYSPEVFDASEKTFDQISVLAKMAIEAALSDSIGAWWNDSLRPRHFDHGNEMVGIVTLVGNNGLCRKVFDCLGGTVDVGNLTCREDYPQWIAQGIDRHMQLACKLDSRLDRQLMAGRVRSPTAAS